MKTLRGCVRGGGTGERRGEAGADGRMSEEKNEVEVRLLNIAI